VSPGRAVLRVNLAMFLAAAVRVVSLPIGIPLLHELPTVQVPAPLWAPN
jgi:hypothetical protein